MTLAELERWRIHHKHCPSRSNGEPCWGPDACKICTEMGNVKPPRRTA